MVAHAVLELQQRLPMGGIVGAVGHALQQRDQHRRQVGGGQRSVGVHRHLEKITRGNVARLRAPLRDTQLTWSSTVSSMTARPGCAARLR